MDGQFENSLLQAIKKDDIKAFNALMEKAQCGTYRLGRFPVLSLLYLYKSRKILSEYEESFLKIASYEELGEPLEVSKKFSAKARKCLRLYLDEVVSPLEMLLILDRTQHLKKVFPMAKPSSAVKGRLKAIYSIKYSLGIKYVGDSISLDRRPLSYREKKRLATLCVSVVLIIAIAIGVPVTTVSLLPKHVDGEVVTFSDIKFNSATEYTLKKDVYVPENFSVERMNCSINGDGKKLILGKGATLGELNGEVTDLTIETAGDPIFTAISVRASIKDVTVNVNADVTTSKQSAFVALTNYGRIDGVTVNVTGKVKAIDPYGGAPHEGSNDFAFGGIVQNNSYTVYNNPPQIKDGIIYNCTVNYSQFTLTGEVGANATFGGIVGSNDGTTVILANGNVGKDGGIVQSCTVNGEIIADTFDVAGICSVNDCIISKNVNNAKLSQTSASNQWNPNTCGIVLHNNYIVENCVNNGDMSAVSTCEIDEENSSLTAISAGIAGVNEGNIYDCTNDGAVTANGNSEVCAGGIAAQSLELILNCVSNGNITADAQTVYAGGITAQLYGLVSNCLSSGDITANAQTVYAGGIAGLSGIYRYALGTGVEDSISKVKISVTTSGKVAYVGGISGYIREVSSENVYYGGGVTNSYFIGECTAGLNYFGAIVGVCGAHVYESNSYSVSDSISTVTYKRFDGNFYLNTFSSAFGATVIDVKIDEETTKEEFAIVADKGATPASLDYIQDSKIYKAILEALENN